ncbi:ricin B-like lectin [Gyrodon lividus]|nr:ricin B-like lectin [Gyrodon lividus]
MANIQSYRIYCISNVKATTSFMDISQDDTYMVIGYAYHNGPNQAIGVACHFRVSVEVAERELTLLSSVGKYMAISGQPHNGQKVVASSSPFAWHVEDQPGAEGVVRVVVPGTNFSLDLSDYGNSASGTPVQLWSKGNRQNQLWRLEKL